MVYDVVDNLTRIEISGENSVNLLNRLKLSGTEAQTNSSRSHLKTIQLGRIFVHILGYNIFFLDVIETIGEIIDDRMLNQNHCNCSLASTKTGGLFSCNFGQNNSKTFDPVEVNNYIFSEL